MLTDRRGVIGALIGPIRPVVKMVAGQAGDKLANGTQRDAALFRWE
jgi:hypothetical protein